MHNPSNDNCPINADPRNESCACDPPWNGQIELTPAFEHIFESMLKEAQRQAQAKDLFDCIWSTVDERLEIAALRAVQRFLAPLNIAAQCMTNREAVEQFREALNAIVQDIDHTAGEIETGMESRQWRKERQDQD